MSWQATAWAKATRDHRSHGEKLILMILADYANPETWIAWPTISRLADDGEMHQASVKRCLKSLQDRNFITRLRRGNQYQSSLYLLIGPEVNLDNYVEPALHDPMTGPLTGVSRTVQPTSVGRTGSSVGRTKRVKVASDASVGRIPVAGSRQEYPIEEPKEPPRWWSILGKDKRWPKTYDPSWGDIVAEQYEKIDLEAEAFKAATWLGTAKGLHRKPRGMKTFWLNWLVRVSKDIEQTPAPSQRTRPNTVEEIRKAKARTNGAT